VRELTDDERDAYAEDFYAGQPVEWPRLCPWCEEKPPVDEFGFYCSEACVHEAGTLEPYSSVHPRPEEVG
jgi:hypothetical protein